MISFHVWKCLYAYDDDLTDEMDMNQTVREAPCDHSIGNACGRNETHFVCCTTC